ncbi:nucleotidyltransferase family protein [Roseospirillum parvum]|uniref:MurNAc alpha-1-phosphate uridylyltransferase n=1 Tax=Roseospirillum parvum TaxID=83401 RepID=A0A1G7ZGE9_9PROT|nr:nucleotidyltransferase family protein [Roseospirillum parvum]SDH07821.1 MurNAc alpha-1-phosphate uridylyltransferase [Roseospirillum parvum]
MPVNESRFPDTAPRRAMVLAAGLGTRMRPITEHTPKPMVEIEGISLIQRILDHLKAAQVEQAVVNLHHLAGRLEDHLSEYAEGKVAPRVVFSDERARLMETGGGLVQARPLLGDDPLYVINGDVLWFDGGSPALARLAHAWEQTTRRGAEIDALLMLHSTPRAHGYDGLGDFFLDPWGTPRRRREKEVAPYVFAGVQIIHPRLLDDAPEEPFSVNRLWNRALEAGRLRGLSHDGEWYHVGTPADIDRVERLIRDDSPFPDVAHR